MKNVSSLTQRRIFSPYNSHCQQYHPHFSQKATDTFHLTAPWCTLPWPSSPCCAKFSLLDCSVHTHFPLLWRHVCSPPLLRLRLDWPAILSIIIKLKAVNFETKANSMSLHSQIFLCLPAQWQKQKFKNWWWHFAHLQGTLVIEVLCMWVG